MRNFIPRLYKNIETNKKIKFNDLAKLHMKMPLGGRGFEKQHQSNIAIILAEPASGKTFQLKEYNKLNDKSLFVELINLQDTDIIDENIDVVLIDSIDEALTDYDNPKKLQDKLTRFIKRCMEVNSKVRFVISCRFLEWNNYFKDSLKQIDKELRVYEILPLSSEDLDRLIKEQGKDSKIFWEFVHKNYLEDLLKNILIVLHLIENFEEYENSSRSYIEIYQDIAKKYLSQKGEDRQSEFADILLEKLLFISSSLATYMTFNRKQAVNVEDLEKLASELYKVEGKDILVSELELVLNRGLFEKKEKIVKFFHNSIQEYLTAYFLAKKNISADELKNLLANEFRFYEEFEEVVVYLTNLQPELFDEFVHFDPFIFKRHPNLSKDQQEKLFLSILNKYKENYSQIWGRWRSFEGTTLVKFDKLDNLVEKKKKKATLKDHGFYLMKLVTHNYTDKLEKYIFDIFEKNISDTKTLKNVIRDNFIDNYSFNSVLYVFLKKYNLLEKDLHQVFISFEAELFSSLYGIKYRYKYGEDRIAERTDIDFKIIVPLLDYIPATSLKYIAPYLLKQDAKEWFEYVIKNYDKNKYSQEYISWVVQAFLKYSDSEESIKYIATCIKRQSIFLPHTIKKEMKLNFDSIKDLFWKVYFETDVLEEFKAKKIIDFYDISLDDIKMASTKYSINEYIEKYIYFRLLGDEVDNFLMQNGDFNAHMQSIWKQHKEQERKREEEFRRANPELADKKKNEKQAIDETINRFATKDEKDSDIYYIYNVAAYEYNGDYKEQDEYLRKILSKKYSIYREQIKQNFKQDTLYIKIKEDLLSSSIYYDTHCFNYLIETATQKELVQIIKSKRDYIKLFWHIYKNSLNSFSDKFITLSEKYFDCFVLLSLQALRISLKQSDGRAIENLHLSIYAFKEMGRLNNKYLRPIINYLANDNNFILKLKESYKKDTLLEILSLDKSNYSTILEFMFRDKKNLSLYLKYLLQIDTLKALTDFFKIYDNAKRYKSIWLKLKERFLKRPEKLNVYDNPKINKKKRELYFQLMRSLKNTKDILDAIPENYYKNILNDYYEFFNQYETPKGAYSPDIYDDMYYLINDIWNHMQNSKYIEVLKELRYSQNKRLSDGAKYTLTKAYEYQRKERNYPNSFYKNIFNKDENMKEKCETHIHGDVYGAVHNNGEIKQTFHSDSEVNKIKSWYKQWWVISFAIGVTASGVSYWNFQNIKLSFFIGLMAFVIMLFFNPKRRFFRLGLTLFSVGSSLNIISFIGKLTIPKNDIFYGFVELQGHDFSIQGFFLIVASMFIFWLDYKENKSYK